MKYLMLFTMKILIFGIWLEIM